MVPTATMRFKQYRRNKESLSKVQSIEECPYDWVITIAFYSALHLVEYHLISENKKKYSLKKKENHEERNRLIIREQELGSEVADAYRALYNESQQARYDCIPISIKRAEQALEYLQTIEHSLSI